MADFQTIKQQVSITQVLEMLDIKGLTQHGDTLRGYCPVCKEGNNRAFVVTPARNIFYCFSERKGGSVIDLVARFKRIPESQAGQQIAAHFGLNGTNGAGKGADNTPSREEPEPSRKSATFDPRAYLEALDPAHEALRDLGVSVDTFRHFKAGYCAKGLNRGRLAVAWADCTGIIKAFIGVALNGESPQYVLPKGMLMPFWFGVDQVEEGRELRIVPAVIDVLTAFENGCTNVICPLALTNGDALTSLKALVDEKSLILEF